ncbi:Hypothetical protein TPAS_881 [Trichococcus pasteurii]|uniref:Uncharacterized protein n=1 Tax=Trichococcus pasteurii TaxID=43064 RepID=A0A1W1IDU6_9LACT|nr:hypothetical protein SAMN04488086_10168 [Trichococcus pasteurii]SLM51205.1 Hypothetical protein TPAS_881 [Trichococcus pasteurii]SSB92086.1 Hypothetical protein TPAS_881 [Trichococcus pasteurii]
MNWRSKQSSGSGCSAKSELAQTVMVELEAEPFAGFRSSSVFNSVPHTRFHKNADLLRFSCYTETTNQK